MSGAPNVWAPNVPDRQISGRQMSGAGNVPTAYCLGHLLSREPNFRAPNVPTPIVGRGSAGAKCTTTVLPKIFFVVGDGICHAGDICVSARHSAGDGP